MSRCWLMSEMLDCFVTPQAYGRGIDGPVDWHRRAAFKTCCVQWRLGRNPPVQREWIHGAND